MGQPETGLQEKEWCIDGDADGDNAVAGGAFDGG